MTFDEFYTELVKIQPRLADSGEKITFSVPGFRELLRKTYMEGYIAKSLEQSKGLGDITDFLQGAS
jgi:hypothetical protein